MPPGGRAPTGKGQRQTTFISQPASYSLSPNNSPPTAGGAAFVRSCFICQLVDHRAADCPNCPDGGREKGQKSTLLPTGYFIFGFGSFQPPE